MEQGIIVDEKLRGVLHGVVKEAVAPRPGVLPVKRQGCEVELVLLAKVHRAGVARKEIVHPREVPLDIAVPQILALVGQVVPLRGALPDIALVVETVRHRKVLLVNAAVNQ